MNKILIIITLILSVTYAVAYEIVIKDDLSKFTFSPEIKDVKLDFKLPVIYRNYTENILLSEAKDAKLGYEPKEPSDWYDGKTKTFFASFFSDDAYRNYLLRLYLDKNYQEVISYYNEKKGSFDGYKDEADLIYALAMQYTAKNKAFDLIKNICFSGSKFNDIACDNFFSELWQKKDYDQIIESGEQLKYPLPLYTFSIFATAYFQKNDYKKMSDLIEEHPQHIFYYPRLNDLRAVLAYDRGDYHTAKKLAEHTTQNIAFIITDAYLNLNMPNTAMLEMKSLTNEEDINYLTAKYYFARKMNDTALRYTAKVRNEEYLMEIMRFYVNQEFPYADATSIYKFKLNKPSNVDYPVYFDALQNMAVKNYQKAAELFSKITSPHLKDEAVFMRGIALIYFDPEKAESDIIKILESTNEKQISKARFMLAQAYYNKNYDGEALQLIDACEENYCTHLKAEIFIERDEYDMALDTVKSLNTEPARVIRATVLYNSKKYNEALIELSKAITETPDVLHLKMMIAFKQGRRQDALNILANNVLYNPLLYDGSRQLIANKEYKLAESYINAGKNLSPDLLALKAKLLLMRGDIRNANIINSNLVKQQKMLYDAYTGLVYAEKNNTKKLGLIRDIVQKTNSMEFEDKDLMLVNFSSEISKLKDNVLQISVINNFFPKYEDSRYAADMYVERAKLFYITGRLKECLADYDSAINLNEKYADTYYFNRTECLEGVDNSKATDIYIKMYETKSEYKDKALEKILMVSENPVVLIKYASNVKKDSKLYLTAMRRYVQYSSGEDLKKNTALVKQLIGDKSKGIKCAGYFAAGKAAVKPKDAAENFAKVYGIDRKDYFAYDAVLNAAENYEKAKMKKEADSMRNIIKKM